MSKKTIKPAAPVARTSKQIRAEASALLGRASLTQAALAALDDDTTPPSPDGNAGELWLYGIVGGYWWGFNAESVAEALRSLDVDTLYVRIHSPGGYAPDGIAIGNLLRNHKAKVIVVVDGLAASAASVIAIAGDEIVMCPGSQMMLHDAMTYGYGNATQLRRSADWIDGQSANYAGVYMYKAGGTVEQWREIMLANDATGTWYTAEAAVTAGLADEVGTRTAVGSPPTASQDDGWWDDEEMLLRAEHDLQLIESCVPQVVRAAWSGTQPPKPPTASAGGSNNPEGGPAVAFSDEQLTTLRQKLGVAETADEATILAALDEALDERADTAPAPAAPAATTQVPEGMTLIETDVLASLRTGAADGTAARTEQRAQARERALTAAVEAGKITPARRKHFAALWDADPDGTRQTLDALAAGLVPLEERGHAEDSETSTPTSADVRATAGYKQLKKAVR